MRARDENKEIAIREKAIEMIVHEGFDGLSMHKLAKAANISVSTIYIYFKNREDLVNQLYIVASEIFIQESLKDFDPEMDFEAGLWLQWNNRCRYITKYPLHHHFSEQFRNSPLIKNQQGKQDAKFRSVMQQFVKHAIAKKQVVDLPPEIFWAIAYGPFYTLVKFHMDNATMSGKPFSLSEQTMRQTFQLVMKSLRPS
ncbi:TetR family transcriptional regulator [Chitinophaga niastensis]|uniref:TetR family transcriptional regulator n=1 Tax=Chitinophaga niastensis TaxID=536980 RepID=A0A2P8HJ70_CHINA|nr:TetR/AcrR family transcriptional regulator [Chitinophaga niastensis]PSL46258.1 TetR family transcriptional regulator [Chitinophaga niastensis]